MRQRRRAGGKIHQSLLVEEEEEQQQQLSADFSAGQIYLFFLRYLWPPCGRFFFFLMPAQYIG